LRDGGIIPTVENPKAFIIYASEGKGCFMLEFAKKIRSKGVNVRIGKWETKPGDSIVDKIFEEG